MPIKRCQICLFLFFLIAIVHSETKDVLIIHSYHEGFIWTDEMNRAIQDHLNEFDPEIEYFVEYMDSKRVSPENLYPNLYSLYKKKYQENSIDLIILTDNNAFDFLRMYRNELFGLIPVVFCGVNNFMDDQITDFPLVTGVTETTDLLGTIELMLNLQPDLTHIAGVTDSVPTGLAHLRNFGKLKIQLKDRVDLITLGNLTEDEMKKALKDLPEKTAIIYLSFFKDRNGKDYSISEGVKLISHSTGLPVYILWDWGVGLGTVGGMVTSGENQGREAAVMAARILSGESPENIPIIKESPNIPMFDYRQLYKISADINDLPAGSLTINRPITIYEENITLIWFIICLFILLMLLILTLSNDLRRRKKLENILREQKGILKDTLDHIPILVHWKDSEGNIIGSNQSFRERFKKLKRIQKEIYTWNTLNLAEEERNLFLKLEKQVEKEKKPLLFKEYHVKDSKGKEHVYSITIIPFEDPDSPLNIISMIQDITKKREFELQYKQAQKMESLGRLSGGIAHDFNNLLTAVIGAAELIREKDCSEKEKHEYLQMILETADRAHELVNGLLTYSRKAPMTFTKMSVLDLVESSVNLLKHTLNKVIRISIDELSPNLQIQGDKSMLQSALLNLGINAGDAMPNGGDLIFSINKVRKEEIENETLKLTSEEYLSLSVKDTGEGIKQEVLDKLFDPFFTTKSLGKGTGLGLAGVYGCITSHNGQILVRSQVGSGSVFEIFLPLVTDLLLV